MTERHPSYVRLMAAASDLDPPITGSTALANAIGEAAATVTNWGARGVSTRGAAKAQSALGISTTWTLEGVEPMFIGDAHAAGRRSGAPAISAAATTPGYVRFQLLEGAGGMGDGVVNEDYPEVIRDVEMAEWEVRRKIGFLPQPGRVALITGRGPSMRPMIDHGDVVMVDTSIRGLDGDGVYVISIDGETQIKMLQRRDDGLWVVSANPDYPDYRVSDPDSLHIGGRVVSALGVREL